eukprot:6333306-Amphidinium_carterae.1
MTGISASGGFFTMSLRQDRHRFADSHEEVVSAVANTQWLDVWSLAFYHPLQIRHPSKIGNPLDCQAEAETIEVHLPAG